jgi:hypothetical protein
MKNQNLTTESKKRTIQVTLSRQYYKEVTINVEVEESITDDSLVDYLTQSEEVNESIEKAISEASLMPGDEKYSYFDEKNNNGGTL